MKPPIHTPREIISRARPRNKLTATDTGDQLWNKFNTNRLEDLDLTEEQRVAVRRLTVFEPLPSVKRVVFICTPHRGSYMASNFVVKFANKFLNLPGGLVKAAVQLEKLRQPGVLGGNPITVPTALDNMDASNPFVQTLSGLPIAPGVHAHSIIPVKGSGPPEQGNDGVVKYKSAHLEGVESELVVRSNHSTQSTPETIEEVRRIRDEIAREHGYDMTAIVQALQCAERASGRQPVALPPKQLPKGPTDRNTA